MKMKSHIREVVSKTLSYVLLMGDFNYPDIDWSNWITKSECPDSQEFKFLECIRNCFLFQHVRKPTGVRGSDTPNLLNLIFTNEANMVTSVEYQSAMGKGDHSVLRFNFKCYTVPHNYTKK